MPLYPFFGAHYHQLKDGYLFWHTQRESAGNDTHLSTQGQNLQISFSNLKAEPWHTETAVVHLSLQCFNTDIQQKLYDEALNHQFHFKDNQHRFAERIDHCHPIAPVLNPTGTTAKRWQLITHLLLNTSPLLAESQSKPHPLKQLLRIYQINEDPMQSHLIDSMESVAVDYRISRIPVAGIHGFCNGVFVVIVLNEKHRQCAGTYLFGCVVHRLLTLYVSINNFVQLTFIDKSGETLYQWQPLIGTQANF